LAQKAETKFKEVFLKALRGIPQVWAEKIQQVGKRGTPDILACVGGRFVGIELKKDDKSPPDKLQQHKLKKIASAGGVSIVACPENSETVIGMIAIMARSNKYDRVNMGARKGP